MNRPVEIGETEIYTVNNLLYRILFLEVIKRRHQSVLCSVLNHYKRKSGSF